MSSHYIDKVYEKKTLLSSIFNQINPGVMKNGDGMTQGSSSKYCAFAVLFLFIVLSIYMDIIIRYLYQLFCFGFFLIQNSRLFANPDFFMNFSLIFLIKEQKFAKELSQIAKRINSLLNPCKILEFTFFYLLILGNSKIVNEPKQNIAVFDTITKFLHPPINSLSETLFRRNGIIYRVGMGCEDESIDQGRSYVDKNITISNCYFSRSSQYTGDGGVIYVSISHCSMNVRYSMFYRCFANKYGVIYFFSSNSSLGMICTSRCTASWYHFAYLYASQVNHVEYLSISYCSHATDGYYSIRLNAGNQRVDNTNSSMNNAYEYSGIGITSPSSFISSHCSFTNNMVSNCICICFNTNSGTISMSYANIVQNNSPVNYGVIYVFGEGSRKMMYCIFHNNQNFLFCAFGGSLEVSHSFIEHSSSSLSTSTPLSPSTNNSFTIRMTFQIQFFNSHHCNADLPVTIEILLNTFDRTNFRSFSFIYLTIILMIS